MDIEDLADTKSKFDKKEALVIYTDECEKLFSTYHQLEEAEKVPKELKNQVSNSLTYVGLVGASLQLLHGRGDTWLLKFYRDSHGEDKLLEVFATLKKDDQREFYDYACSQLPEISEMIIQSCFNKLMEEETIH